MKKIIQLFPCSLCVPWAVILNIAFMTLQCETPYLPVVKNLN